MTHHISQHTLACGMPLIVENMPNVRSVALRWLIPVGSALDEKNTLGTAEVLAELLMRGSETLDSRAQANAFDTLGASRAVSNGARFLRLSSTLLADNLLDALPLIADVVRRPRLAPESLEPSRRLALQQLQSLADDPQERAVLGARAAHYPDPFSRSGLGTEEGLGAITREQIARHYASHATPQGCILAIAGNVPGDGLVPTLDRLLRGWEGRTEPPACVGTGPRGQHHTHDEANQTQIVLVHDAPPEPHEDSVLERVVVAALSGGMSSRLFTEVREKRGLCYAVHASYRAEKDFGSVTAYVGTTPDRADEALDVLHAELRRVSDGLTPEEFDRAITGLTSRIVFSGESTSARANAVANDFFKRGQARTLAEFAETIHAVTLDRVNDYLRRRTLGELTIQTLGPRPVASPAGVVGATP
ncbi:MAG: M16 family metallopeptidase [Phycisphaerales bacterium JB040]